YEVTLSASHGTLTLSTLAGLTFTAGDGTSDATMTFHGTLADINTALATASYLGNADYNGVEAIVLHATEEVGGAVATGSGAPTGDPATVAFTVAPVDDAPHVAAPSSFGGKFGIPLSIGGISFSDVDANGASELATFHAGAGTLTAASGGGVTVTGSGTGTVTLSGTLANLDAFIAGNHLSYTNLSSASDTLGITIHDQGHTGLGGPLTGHVDVPVATPLPAPDAPPVNFLTGPFLAQADTDFAIAGFSISDPDGGNGIETTTLSVQHGILTVGSVAGGAAII